MFSPRKEHTFQKIDIFHSKPNLGAFLSPFLSLGGASGSLLAPNWVSLAALGAPRGALGMPQGPAGTSPGASWEAAGRCWRAFGHLNGSLGCWEPHFGLPAIDFHGFTTVFRCGEPCMIRTNLARGGMCAALRIRRALVAPGVLNPSFAWRSTCNMPLAVPACIACRLRAKLSWGGAKRRVCRIGKNATSPTQKKKHFCMKM